MSFSVAPQWRGVRVVPAGPRLFLHQLNMAATPAHDISHQDVGSGAADTGVKALMLSDDPMGHMKIETHTRTEVSPCGAACQTSAVLYSCS